MAGYSRRSEVLPLSVVASTLQRKVVYAIIPCTVAPAALSPWWWWLIPTLTSDNTRLDSSLLTCWEHLTYAPSCKSKCAPFITMAVSPDPSACKFLILWHALTPKHANSLTADLWLSRPWDPPVYTQGDCRLYRGASLFIWFFPQYTYPASHKNSEG